MNKATLAIIGLIVFAMSATCSAKVIETTRLVGFGQAKYPDGFAHFDYVNPDAPKYGKITYGRVGTFDNFNRYASRGVVAAGMENLYDSLMYSPSDEIDAYYPLIAEKVRYSDDYSWLEVDINPNARFHDGQPITAHDVAFTFSKFMKEGVPQYRVFFKNVKSVIALSDQTARIEMAVPDRDKLFTLTEGMVVLPEHFWKDKNLSEPLLTPPVASGPYRVSDYKMGESITYALDPHYWAKNLSVNVGRHNFAQIEYDYYRDDTVMLEAFKAGEFDFRLEGSAKLWVNAYTGTNFDKGYIKKEVIPYQQPAPANGFVFNTQRPIFQDPKVREALGYALDFQWMNKTLFYNQYSRVRSYFQNTEFEAKGLPDQAERAVLAPFKDRLPPRLFTEEYHPPVTDGSGRIRPQMRRAFALLKEAGWEVQNMVMTNVKTHQPFVFELLIYNSTDERKAIPLQKNLKKLGIEMKIRSVDTTQYIKRLRDRDFDMVSSTYSPNAYPSPYLLISWHSHYIDSTYNKAGVQDPIIDSLLERIVDNQTHSEKLGPLGRALDRVLQWHFYIIPQWYMNEYHVAMWDKFERPKTLPKYGLAMDSWWISQQKAAHLPEKRR